MTVDDLLDGHFMDGSEDEEEDDIGQVSSELLHRLTTVYPVLGFVWAGRIR
jgi:hypothetical protein